MTHQEWMEVAQSYARLDEEKIVTIYLRDGTELCGQFTAIEVSQDVFLRMWRGTNASMLVPAWAIVRIDLA